MFVCTSPCLERRELSNIQRTKQHQSASLFNRMSEQFHPGEGYLIMTAMRAFVE